MRPVFLVGYMGCGKSTLGRAVAKASGLRFIDLDLYIEGRYHRSVSQLFAERGEEGFRMIERNIIREVADFEDVIVACGGGTPCFFDNMRHMNACGLTVFLDTSVHVLFDRLKKGRFKRPLIAGKSDEELLRFISEALEARMPHYGEAAAVFPSDDLESAKAIESSVKKFLDRFDIPLKNER